MQYQSIVMTASASATHTLREEFQRLRGKAVRHRLFSRITGQPCQLRNLAEVQKAVEVRARVHGGLKLVPIEKIRGSLNRCQDFDSEFRPLQEYTEERWITIAGAHCRDESLPPVELVELDDTYYVTDGHHRISVARMMGQREIEAEVTVWYKGSRATAEEEQESKSIRN